MIKTELTFPFKKIYIIPKKNLDWGCLKDLTPEDISPSFRTIEELVLSNGQSGGSSDVNFDNFDSFLKLVKVNKL